MTNHKFEPSRHVLSLLKGLFRRQRPILLYLSKKFELESAPLPLLCYLSFSVIWLLQNFSPTTYRPLLPSRLITDHSKPSNFTTGEICNLLPKTYPPLTLQFGLHQVQFEIYLEIITKQ